MITNKFFILIFIYFHQFYFVFSNYKNEIDRINEEILNETELENSSAQPTSNTSLYNETVNITCILDKYGSGYIGQRDTTYDGIKCIEWEKNPLLYKRYIARRLNMTKNHCRNPDNDPSGPWCFILNKSSRLRNFRFKHCGIPLCKSKFPVKGNTSIGIRTMIKRDCPYGFKRRTVDSNFESVDYCEVEAKIFNKLPNGKYSLELINSSNSNCPEGFQMEETNINRITFCTKISNNSDDVIEFPKYLIAKPGELIFVAMRIGQNISCPQMSLKTSVIIRQFSSLIRPSFITCHYFYKLSNNKENVDHKLAVLVLQKDCPKNWSLKILSYKWKFTIRGDHNFQRQSVYACIPNREIENYPDGDYCLLSLNNFYNNQNVCPKDFVDVNMNVNGLLNVKFCCRQSEKVYEHKQNIYEFFNFSSILIINSGNKCPTKSNQKGLQIKNYNFDAVSYRETFECINCDMFSTFVTNEFNFGRKWKYYKIQFHACSYEKPINGFAYATLNSRCPPDMKYGYIKYSKDRYSSYSSYYTGKITATFCTIVNYPKNLVFPDGRYCIYKLGPECPTGFINVSAKLPLYFYRFTDSGGDLTNYQLDYYCCKMGPINSTFTNKTLPYVTSTFEFGLPYANQSFKCIHGMETHTAVEDSHMCHYYPTTDTTKGVTIVFPSNTCGHKTYTYYGAYRIMYTGTSSRINYCYFIVGDNPPPGNYCAPFAKTCPSTYFYYLTYHPLMQRVICCRKPTPPDQVSVESQFSPSKWVGELKSFSLLAYKKRCPIFERYNYGKEPLKRYYTFYASNNNANHRKNLTQIGFEVNTMANGFMVLMYSCDYKLDPYNKSVTWPHGQYAFPRPLSGCPSNFQSGNFTHFMETVNPSFAHSDVIHLDGDYMIGGSTIKWGFCVKKDNYKKERLLLPYGRYCLMKVDYSCPSSFSEGSVKFVEITALNKVLIQRDGILPKIETDGPFITYHFCCQSGRGDVVHEPMYLPTESGSFFLMKFGTYCQAVFGMKVSEEFICIDSEDSSQYLNYTFQSPYKTEGLTPITGSFVRGCDFQINLCYYEKELPTTKPNIPKPGPMISWPKGSYVFIKPLSEKCPTGFDEGRVTVQTFFKFYPKFMHYLMFGSNDENHAVFSFCKRNSTIIDTAKPTEEWPNGNYCLIFEKKCPRGMLRHKLRSLEHFLAKKESGAYMSDWSSLCCKDNKTSFKNLPFFPGEFYSIILKPSIFLTTCPPHNSTRVALIDLQNELICHYERRDESVEFPDGDYLMPPPQKPMNSCAPGFKLVEHSHTHLTDDESPQKLSFCQKENYNKNSNASTFPRGNYCILTTQYSCPSSQFTIQSRLSIPNFHFADPPHQFSFYLACCQNDEKIISNLATSKVPLQLYGTTKCSYIDGMMNTKLVEEPTILIQQSAIENPPYVKDDKMLRICKYDQFTVWNFETRCQCHPNATCYLSLDQKNCNCKPGYVGDGITVCAKITNETDQCGNACNKISAYCDKILSMETYSCFCNQGYEGNGFKCKPSCKTRNCNAFSRCIVDSEGSHCACRANAIPTETGQCHSDLSNTIAHLPQFDYLMNMNLKCLTKEAIKHLTFPDKDRTLFIIYPVDNTMFSNCKNIEDYYGFMDGNVYKSDLTKELEVLTVNKNFIKISKNQKHQWMINKEFIPFRQDLFTNAVVLYFNSSIDLSFNGEWKHMKIKTDSRASFITKFLIGVILILTIIGVLAFLVIRKRRNGQFSRLYETRSESNIHFITADEKIEIES